MVYYYFSLPPPTALPTVISMPSRRTGCQPTWDRHAGKALTFLQIITWEEGTEPCSLWYLCTWGWKEEYLMPSLLLLVITVWKAFAIAFCTTSLPNLHHLCIQ